MKVERKSAKERGVVVETKNDESFFSRWNRRKTEAKSGTAATEEESSLSTLENSQPEIRVQEEPATLSEISQNIPTEETEYDEVVVLSDEDMPDIETLNEESDFSQFLSEGVSDELRNKALRKLFHLPEFNIRDGLNDYDEDFSQIPKLSQALAGQVRQWVEEQKEDFNTALNNEDSSEPAKSEDTESSLPTPDEDKPHFLGNELADAEEDDLGDADLES